MNYYLLAFFLILFAGCQNKDSLDEKYDRALAYKENKEYRESNIILNDILESSEANEDIKIKSYFLLAQIFYDLKNYIESVESYKKILKISSDSPLRKKALFMVAYTYFNDLDMYTHSIEYYNIFKTEYPDDELIKAVDFELNQINDILDSK